QGGARAILPRGRPAGHLDLAGHAGGPGGRQPRPVPAAAFAKRGGDADCRHERIRIRAAAHGRRPSQPPLDRHLGRQQRRLGPVRVDPPRAHGQGSRSQPDRQQGQRLARHGRRGNRPVRHPHLRRGAQRAHAPAGPRDRAGRVRRDRAADRGAPLVPRQAQLGLSDRHRRRRLSRTLRAQVRRGHPPGAGPGPERGGVHADERCRRRGQRPAHLRSRGQQAAGRGLCAHPRAAVREV
ncbi:MAG: GH2, partial [uncultured Sphingomonadaceae bacterium]